MRSSHNLLKSFTLFLAMVLMFCIYTVKQSQQTATTQVKEETKVVAKQVDQKQLRCLATNLYFEAGGEPTQGIAAVARVVMNRIQNGFGNTPCQVVYQANMVKQTNEDDETFWVKVCQFSWVCEGKSNPPTHSARYQKSLQVAYDVLAYDKYNDVVPKNTLYFHNTSYTNEYPHEVTARIGNHVFYARKKIKKNVKRKSHRYFKQSSEAHILNGETQTNINDRS